MGMTIDFSDFEKGFKKVTTKVVPKQAAEGLFKGGNELLRDAIKIAPKVPVDIGDLKASAKVNKAEITKDGIELIAGFDIEYAARWHELSPDEDSRIAWTLPGSGRKYLESKMVTLKNKYMEIAAKHINRVLK